MPSPSPLDSLPETVIYEILTYLPSTSLARASSSCFLFHVLSRYLLTKRPLWKTLHLRKEGGALPEVVREVQGRVCSKITLAVVFATDRKVFNEEGIKERLSKVLPKDCVAVGCLAATTASVENMPPSGLSPSLPASVEGSSDRSLGTITLASIPEANCSVFTVPTSVLRSSTGAQKALSLTPSSPLTVPWSVILLLTPTTVSQATLSTYLSLLHEANPGVEVIGGIHAGETSFVMRGGAAGNEEAMVGVCVGGNVVYSSQVRSSSVLRAGRCSFDPNPFITSFLQFSLSPLLSPVFSQLSPQPSVHRVVSSPLINTSFQLSLSHLSLSPTAS